MPLARPFAQTAPQPWEDAAGAARRQTARLVLADGTVIAGLGLGAAGSAVGEVCFNTAITGYQEILTDPSYAGQIVTFTFPHIGNVGTNLEDTETSNLAARSGVRGCVLRAPIDEPANYRAEAPLDAWLKSRGIIAIAGIDTRALTARIREQGMPNAVIAHDPTGQFDLERLRRQAKAWPGLDGMDLVPDVTSGQSYTWDEMRWVWGEGYGRQSEPRYHVVAVDYGLKRNILRCLASAGCKVTVVPATTRAEDILVQKPDGVFLSNGPGDPAATGIYAVPEIQKLVASGLPVFGICLGHQLMGLASGARTVKMKFGHHGANHPVLEVASGRVMITSQNHGFAVDEASLPSNLRVTHRSLFDGSVQGLERTDKPAFCFQGHPEASPGPHDVSPLFDRFIEMMDKNTSPRSSGTKKQEEKISL